MSSEDRLAWLLTPLGQEEFAKLLRCITTPQERELLLRWASCRDAHVSQAEFDLCEDLAPVIRAFMERWELAEVPLMERFIAEQLELRLE